jgi:hypothetical protein
MYVEAWHLRGGRPPREDARAGVRYARSAARSVPSNELPGGLLRYRAILDIGSYVTVATTLVLFLVALLVKGFTHDLLLEAGVFLVSIKLIIMAYKNGIATMELRSELKIIRTLLESAAAGKS